MFDFYSSFETRLNLVAMAANEASQMLYRCMDVCACVCVCVYETFSIKSGLDPGFINHSPSQMFLMFVKPKLFYVLPFSLHDFV